MTNHEKIEYLVDYGSDYTVPELMNHLKLTYNRLYVMCKDNGVRPKDSTWCSKTVHGIPPIPPSKPKIQRVKGEYSNSGAYKIDWDNINAHE